MFPLTHTSDSSWSFSPSSTAFSVQAYFYANIFNRSLVEYVLSIKLKLLMVKSSSIIYATWFFIPMEVLKLKCEENEHENVLKV